MIAPRTLFRLALVASIGLTAGCGGATPDVDNAEVVRPPGPAAKETPAPPPATDPAKVAPKG